MLTGVILEYVESLYWTCRRCRVVADGRIEVANGEFTSKKGKLPHTTLPHTTLPSTTSTLAVAVAG